MATETLIYTDRELIIKECGKTREEVERDIDTIVEWFKTQKHLPEIMNRKAIERYLVVTRFSIEWTKQVCDAYYSCREHLPQIFKNSNPNKPENNIYFDTLMHFPLPKLTIELYRVVIYKFTEFEHPNFDPYKLIMQAMAIFEISLIEELSKGDIFIIDCKNLKMSYVLKNTPTFIKCFSFFMQKVWTSRVKSIHLIDIPSFADVVVALSKALTKKKILDRILFHKGYENLSKYIDKSVLPKDYGGDEKSFEELNNLWKEKIASYENMFDRLEKLKVDESLRPVPLENSDILGYYGNFKMLNVD